MPFCKIRLTAPKPRNPDYPKALNTLGDHIRQRRLDLGLLQKQVAEIIGVADSTIYQWETGQAAPTVRHLPKIHQFLGYVPAKPTGTLGQRIRTWRESQGLSLEALAKKLHVSSTALAKWEQDRAKPRAGSLRFIPEAVRGTIGGP